MWTDGQMAVLIFSTPELLSFPFKFRNKAWQVLDRFVGEETSCDSHLCLPVASRGQLQTPGPQPWAHILATFPHLTSAKWEQTVACPPGQHSSQPHGKRGLATGPAGRKQSWDFRTDPGRAKPRTNQAAEEGGSRVRYSGRGSRPTWVRSQLCWSPTE